MPANVVRMMGADIVISLKKTTLYMPHEPGYPGCCQKKFPTTPEIPEYRQNDK